MGSVRRKMIKNCGLIFIIAVLVMACRQPAGNELENLVLPDKTHLFNEINEAQKLYDSLEICTDGKDFPVSQYWVTSEYKSGLWVALDTAETIHSKHDASPWEIEIALKELREAFNAANSAKKPGLIDDSGTGEKPGDGEEPVDNEDPGDGEAPGEGEKPGDGEVPDDGEEPGDGETPGNGEEPGDGGNPDDGEEPGEPDPANKITLGQRINEANAKKANVAEAANGDNVLTRNRWASPAMFTALKAALANAETVYHDGNATQEAVDNAAERLVDAIAAFVPQTGLLEPRGISSIFVGPSDENIILDGAQTLSWVKNDTLLVSVAESFDHYQWYVDGAIRDGETGHSITLNVRDFSHGTHNVTLKITKGGIPHTKTLTFFVN